MDLMCNRAAIRGTLVVLFLLCTPSQCRIDVFTSGSDGYYCYKIPSLLQTNSGSLLAFAEARKPNCLDYALTDLVYKRSTDGGATWGPLQVLYSNSSESVKNVIGNAAPVQSSSGRIIVPFCRNNREVFVTVSEDDGFSWSTPRDISENATRMSWKWVGTGPPASLRLSTGRIITPSYHTIPYTPHEDGETTEGHLMYSDDDGDSWQLGGNFGVRYLSNEGQAAELSNGNILINARTAYFSRMQALSKDQGLTFEEAYLVKELHEPAEGCEMSMVMRDDILWLSGPTEPSLYRQNLTLWNSKSNGARWEAQGVIDSGPAGYSSLQALSDGILAVLYERSNEYKIVMVPDYLTFDSIYLDNGNLLPTAY